MTTEKSVNGEKRAKSNGTWSSRIWGALPWLFMLVMVGVIIFLAMRIGSEQAASKAQKAQIFTTLLLPPVEG